MLEMEKEFLENIESLRGFALLLSRPSDENDGMFIQGLEKNEPTVDDVDGTKSNGCFRTIYRSDFILSGCFNRLGKFSGTRGFSGRRL